MNEKLKLVLQLDFTFWCIFVLAVISPSRSPIRTWEQLGVYALSLALFIVIVNVVLLGYIKLKGGENHGLQKEKDV